MSWLLNIIKNAQWEPESESDGVNLGWLTKLPSNAFHSVKDFIRGISKGWKHHNLSIKEIEEIFMTPNEWLNRHPGMTMNDYNKWKRYIANKESGLKSKLPRQWTNRWNKQTRSRMLKDIFRHK